MLPNQLIHSVDRVAEIISRRRILDRPSHMELEDESYKFLVADLNKDGLRSHILNDRHLITCCVTTALLCNRILNTLEMDQARHDLPGVDLTMSALSPDHRHWQLRPESDCWTGVRGSTFIRQDHRILEPLALQIRLSQ